MHHTQLLNRLVREGKLTPVARRRRSAAPALDHLPRPVLHRPPQPGLRAAARAAPGAARRRVRGDAAQLRAVLLLRRRRRPHVDGGDDRLADQREPHRRGGRHRRRPDRGRLPVLPGDALRRAHRPAGEGRGPRGGRGPRRRADAARLGQGRVAGPKTSPAAREAARSGGGTAAPRSGPRRPRPSPSRATRPRPRRRSPTPRTSARPPRLSGGSSLFDIGGDAEDAAEKQARSRRRPARRTVRRPFRPTTPSRVPAGGQTSGRACRDQEVGSLFDLGVTTPAGTEEPRTGRPSRPAARSTAARDADADVTPRPRNPRPSRSGTRTNAEGASRASADPHPRHEIPEGGSLFDIAEPEDSAPAASLNLLQPRKVPAKTPPATPPPTATSTAATTTPTRTSPPRARPRAKPRPTEVGVGDEGGFRSRRRDLHPRHRDPRGRLPVRHRRTRGLRTRGQA